MYELGYPQSDCIRLSTSLGYYGPLLSDIAGLSLWTKTVMNHKHIDGKGDL